MMHHFCWTTFEVLQWVNIVGFIICALNVMSPAKQGREGEFYPLDLHVSLLDSLSAFRSNHQIRSKAGWVGCLSHWQSTEVRRKKCPCSKFRGEKGIFRLALTCSLIWKAVAPLNSFQILLCLFEAIASPSRYLLKKFCNCTDISGTKSKFNISRWSRNLLGFQELGQLTHLPGFLEAKIAGLWLLVWVHATIETPGSHTRGALPPLPYHTASYHVISYHHLIWSSYFEKFHYVSNLYFCPEIFAQMRQYRMVDFCLQLASLITQTMHWL